MAATTVRVVREVKKKEKEDEKAAKGIGSALYKVTPEDESYNPEDEACMSLTEDVLAEARSPSARARRTWSGRTATRGRRRRRGTAAPRSSACPG